MSFANVKDVRRSLQGGVQIWNGHLWNPHWFRDGELDIGCGELLSVQNPSIVMTEQRALLEAGADAVSTNTFGATPTVMRQYGEEGMHSR